MPDPSVMNATPPPKGSRMGRVRLACRKAWLWVCRSTVDYRFRWALIGGHYEWAQQMLDQGADIDFAPVSCEELHNGYSLRKPRTRMTALHMACIDGDFQVVAWLLDRGANTQLFDTWGTTPMQLAAERGYLHIVALLAAHGESLERGMPIYSTYVEDWAPDTIGQHVSALGFKGDEHLRHLAYRQASSMCLDTPEAASAPCRGDGGAPAMPARL